MCCHSYRYRVDDVPFDDQFLLVNVDVGNWVIVIAIWSFYVWLVPGVRVGCTVGIIHDVTVATVFLLAVVSVT